MPFPKRLPLLLVVLLCASSAPRRTVPPALEPNDNRTASGVLKDGTLTVDLVATEAAWLREGGQLNRASVEAFAERGKAPVLPGPLIRVPVGTNVHVNIHNALTRPLTFFLPTSSIADDSIVVAPGESGVISVRYAAAGNFIYRGIAANDTLTKFLRVGGALAGAVVVDTAGAPRIPRDRVLVIMMTPDSALIAAGPLSAKTDIRQMAFTINGRSWPSTERLSAAVGDTVHWHVINANFDTHPMHLHGFYFRVDSLTGPAVARQGQGDPDRMVVTERMSPFSAMNTTWVPERAGNWLFHCHFSLHLEPPDASGATGRTMPDMKMNHALTGMVGLVMGINVTPRGGTVQVAGSKPARQLRLIATSDPGFPDSMPSYRFTIEEKGRLTATHAAISPALYLTRGEPVAITVVNRLQEPTGVHWHGMELESYFDGVAGLSGTANRLAPMIAPGDSFVARFTPPRAGTFMYHSHVDDVRQQAAGLVGAMIVRDGAPSAAPDDHEIFLKGSRSGPFRNNPLDVNGQSNPDTIVAHAGRPMRLRLMSLATINVSPAVMLTARPDSVRALARDSMLVRWTPVAKDGMEFPRDTRAARMARVIISMGETYDFEFTPERVGQRLRVEVRSLATGVLLARVPIRVE